MIPHKTSKLYILRSAIAFIISASIIAFSGCGMKTNTPNKEIDDNASEEILIDYNNVNIKLSNTEKKETAAQPYRVKTSKSKTTTSRSPAELSWFDDCVFLGDSFTNGLSLYNESYGELGNAQFVCAACIGWVSSQYEIDHPNAFHPTYNGQTVFMYDAPALTNAKKAVITLGMNDVGCFGIEGTLDAAASFIAKVRASSPDVTIYITTVTPMVESAEYDLLNNDLIQKYNERLPVFAQMHDCIFLDTWSVFADENGKLPVDLCIDPDGLGFHLNNNGNHMLCEFYKANLG